jgi:hypothetical protein
VKVIPCRAIDKIVSPLNCSFDVIWEIVSCSCRDYKECVWFCLVNLFEELSRGVVGVKTWYVRPSDVLL